MRNAMSLEQALQDCTSAIHQLIAALGAQTGVAEVRAAGAPQPTVVRDDNAYFHDAAHKVVYCIGPTESLGTRSTLPRITRDEFVALKAEYEALTAAAIAAASKAGPTGAATGAATPAATSTPATSHTDVGNAAGGTATQGAAATPAGSTAAATAAATATTAEPVTWDKHVLPALQALAKKPGDGGAALKGLLAAEGVAMVPPLKAKYVADYAPLLAKINAAQVA